MQSRSIFEIDLYIVISALVLLVIGILFIFSSGVTATGQIASREYLRQIIWATTGLIIMLSVTFLDYRLFYRLAIIFFVVTTIVLLFTPVLGRSVHGARRWLGIGQLGAQPSEFAKLSLILFLARFYSNRWKDARSLKVFLTALAITAVPILLVLAQPDLGTAMVYFPIFLLIALFGGSRPAHILYVTCFVLALVIFTVLPFWAEHLTQRSLPFALVLTDRSAMNMLITGLVVALVLAALGLFFTRRRLFGWLLYGISIVTAAIPAAHIVRMVLRDYQIMRLVVFLNPYVDPRGAGWNIIQSMTAVGSGGLAGKGFLQGTHSHYQYLPAQSTDFIFSILAEEWGFLGVVLVFILFGIILGRSFYVMILARDRFAGLAVAGVAAMYLFHFVVNVGMTIGMMPITGLPLLLLSFGGSSVWTGLIGLGIVMSVYQHRYQY
ncbi:MAG: rod shape-determining protein RodA [Spirochaetaceae bacterium]|nr:MAG: rod shape-determining protein RodA [Spirochaetaceae bacterium]